MIKESDLYRILKGGRRRLKSEKTLKRNGISCINISREIYPLYSKGYTTQMVRTGKYLVEKTSVVGWERPGEYFKEVLEVIEPDTVYIFRHFLEAKEYFLKKVSEKKMVDLISD